MLQRVAPGGRLQAEAGLRARTTQRVAARPSSSQDGSWASSRPLDCFASPLKAGAMIMTSERTAIVTGAGKRVGAEIARALLDDGWSELRLDRKSTRLNSSHSSISYAVFCLKKKNKK